MNHAKKNKISLQAEDTETWIYFKVVCDYLSIINFLFLSLKNIIHYNFFSLSFSIVLSINNKKN